MMRTAACVIRVHFANKGALTSTDSFKRSWDAYPHLLNEETGSEIRKLDPQLASRAAKAETEFFMKQGLNNTKVKALLNSVLAGWRHKNTSPLSHGDP